MNERAPSCIWRHRFAILAALATFPLVFVGGAVTSKNAGLAVPDWPLSYGSINPPGWWRIDHVLYEHGHRLLGWTVGTLTLVQAIWVGAKERRRGVRMLGYALLAGVTVQGIMGGLRVTEISTALALIHGCFGQFVFCGMVIMAVVSSSRWPQYPSRPLEPGGYSPRLAVATLAALIVQLTLGALVRHKGLTVLPHAVGSLVVMAMIHSSMGRVLRSCRDVSLLRVSAILAGVLVVVQMGLGVVAWAVTTGMDDGQTATLLQWAMPTVHVAVGAIILACAAVMTVVIFRVSESSLTCASPLPNAPLSAS